MKYLLAVLFLIMGVVMRVVPFAPNFTPLLSISLLTGLYTKNRYFVILPILIMLISDLYIGNHITAIWVYSSLLLIFVFGYFMKKSSYTSIVTFSIISSITFFIVSNFGVWVTGGYSHTFEGLITCYLTAIPFYKNTLLSTILYSSSIHFIVSFIPSLNKQLRVN